MAVWKEIRCDGGLLPGCLSSTNLGPMGFGSAAELKRRARKEGWIIRGDHALCPPCRKRQGAQS